MMENTDQVPLAADSKNFHALSDRLQTLKMLQREFVRVEMDFHREFYAIDMKYQQQRDEIFNRRKSVISGEGDSIETNESIPSDVTTAVTEALQKMRFDKSVVDGDTVKGIPNFWLQALKNCTNYDELIREGDEEALSYLADIRVILIKEPEMSFKLEFEFAPNPFFENAVLTKQYYLSSDSDDEFYGFSIIRAIGCKIDWKDGMNIGEKEPESFFNFFNPPELADNSTAKSTENVANFFESNFDLQQDFETGLFIKEKLVPNAVLYYINEIDDVTGECAEFNDNDETIVSETNL